jgi:RNA polymerase-binding protein DksA
MGDAMAERSKAADKAGTGGTGAGTGSGLDASAAPRRKRAAGAARGGAPSASAAAEKSSGTGARSSTRKSAEESTTAAGSAAKGATMVKSADTKSARKPAAKGTRTAAETEKIRAALAARRDELRAEYNQTLTEITELQRDRLTDSAGDDQADTGTKTFEREQEISLANSILDRITQVERALERLDDGSYGWCERCGNPIPVERLAAFPSATLCVSCKQLEERR